MNQNSGGLVNSKWTEVWLKLLDYEPENVAAVRLVKAEKQIAATRRNIIQVLTAEGADDAEERIQPDPDSARTGRQTL